MEMINRLLSDSIDGRKFVGALVDEQEQRRQKFIDALHADEQEHRPTTIAAEYSGMNRQQRRARERAERRSKTTTAGARR